MNHLRLDLPVIPRVAKWLRAHYRQEQLTPTAHDPRLAQLWALLQTPSAGKFRATPPPSGVVIVKVSVHQFDPSRGRYPRFTPPEVRIINTLLDTYLYGEFAQLARQIGQAGGTARQAAREFCDKYDFAEGDLSEETLKRVWNRQQQRGNDGKVGFDDGVIATLLCKI